MLVQEMDDILIKTYVGKAFDREVFKLETKDSCWQDSSAEVPCVGSSSLFASTIKAAL